MSEEVWAAAEFAVQATTTWQPCCAECLPILIRRAHRKRPAVSHPRVMPCYGPIQCKVRDPHPAPGTGIPYDGYSCPRPLTNLCLDAACDHD